jgi:hypothetical protein
VISQDNFLENEINLPVEPEKKVGKPLLTLLRVLVAGGALYLVFRGEDLSELWEMFLSLDWWAVVGGVGLYMAAQLLFAVRWRLILSVHSISISYVAAVKLHLLGLFYNNCLPSSLGGDFLRAWYVTRHTVKNKRLEAALSVFVDRFVGLVGMIITATAAFVVVNLDREGFDGGAGIDGGGGTNDGLLNLLESLGEYQGYIWWVLGLLAVLFTVLIFIKPLRTKLVALIGKMWSMGFSLVVKCFIAMKLYFKKPLTVLMALGLTIFLQAVAVLGVYIVGRNMGLEAHIKYYYVLFPVSWLVGAIPVSIGGMGVMEGWLKVMFQKMAGQGSLASAAVAVSQRLIWLVGSVPGLFIHIFGAHLPVNGDNESEFFVDDE